MCNDLILCYNSKFQEFEAVRTLKIQKKRPNLEQNNFLGPTIMRTCQGCQCLNKKIFLVLKRVLEEHRNVGVIFFM